MVRFAYIDESGDTGFKRLGKGTPDYFVITLLLVDDPGPVHAGMDALRDELSLSRREEFKFSKNSKPRRIQILENLRRCVISVRALVVHKALLMGKPESRSQELLFGTLVRHVLVRNCNELDDTKLVIDEYVRDKRRQREMNAAIRQALNRGQGSRRIREVVHQPSHTDVLVQATDMVSGAIYASRAHGNEQYLNIIRTRVHEIWDWDGEVPVTPVELELT
ncbi:MAG: DUF3800 domain-containing protein [Thermomicrobiales bacterium]